MGIKVGAPAPDAAADYWIRGAHGPRRMTLAEHRGKWLVLFFYPRDFTFICPTELVAFGELEADFKAEEAVVIGASTDSFFSHKAWFETDARLLRVNYPVAGRYLPPAQQGIRRPIG
jgi:alkyl hydroperoxide reductase subunit AhpC